MRKVEIIGKFFDNHSLAIINRKLAIGLSEVDNIEVFINPLDQYDPQYNVSSTDLKALKKLKKRPLLANLKEAKKLYDARRPEYLKLADIVINVTDKSAHKCAKELLKKVKKYV